MSKDYQPVETLLSKRFVGGGVLTPFPPSQDKMKEEIHNINSRELLNSVMDNMGRCMNYPIDDHPHWGAVKRELEERLESWKRIGPRRLKVKSI